jgi:maltose alpha-D-glucosyltransferase/alpha-amylase
MNDDPHAANTLTSALDASLATEAVEERALQAVPNFQRSPQWYKDAIIYQMHVKAFYDANGDGIGDFAGLTQRLDYIQELGVNTIWLLPFYPSPLRDDGYDIADYCDVHPDYGTLDDFKNFIEEAHRRGLKVITELVINHTSDKHPWFQAARNAPPGSPEREFYVWSDDDQKLAGTRIIFTDTEVSNWAWDPVAKQYYWHRFFSHQPDLNHNNPRVVEAVIEVMRFWMELGVDGMRLDAIPYLCVREGTNNENLPETHAVLKRMRAAMDREFDARMFLAEANQWPEDVREYFGDGDECHMAYHFPLMPRMFMAVALEDRYPITEILRQTPEIPESCQWAIFLRNHDELTLEMVTDRERDYMYRMYAQEPRMRVNVGIRRRLAPLLRNDVDLIKLMNSLLLSMPGSPIIYYGDEIGMGDNIYIGDRNGVRTPMQWSLDRNAGFSRADPQRLYLPVIMDPIYGFQAVNVEAQSRDGSSLLNWTRRILAVRKQLQCFGRGSLEFVRAQNRKVFAYIRRMPGEIVLCVANLSSTAQAVEIDLAEFKGLVPVELLGRNAFPPIGELPYFLTLQAHGFFWLLLSDSAPPPAWHIERMPATELPVLVLLDGLATLLPDNPKATTSVVIRRTVQQLEQEVLPAFLAPRGWFAQRAEEILGVRLSERTLWRSDQKSFVMSFIEVHSSSGWQRYFLPLTLAWEDLQEDGALRTAEWTLAKVREHAKGGALIDAFADPTFCVSLVRCVAKQSTVPFAIGELRCEAMTHDEWLGDVAPRDVQMVGAETTNTSVVLNDQIFLKAYRRAESGTNPDTEMIDFLMARGFGSVAKHIGTISYVEAGTRTELVALFAYIRNQGDVWSYALDHLERFLAAGAVEDEENGSPHALFNAQMTTLGKRIGQLHALLASEHENPAFAPEPLTADDFQAWLHSAQQRIETLVALMRESAPPAAENSRLALEDFVARRGALLQLIEGLSTVEVDAEKMRVHGNLHLGKVLLVADDFLVTGFEGDALLPFAERRRKGCVLSDLATLVGSLDYIQEQACRKAVLARPEQHERMAAALSHWVQGARSAMLKGYRSGVGDAPFLPRSDADAERIMRFFRIKRLLRELEHELKGRASWTGIPLQLVLREVHGA